MIKLNEMHLPLRAKNEHTQLEILKKLLRLELPMYVNTCLFSMKKKFLIVCVLC